MFRFFSSFMFNSLRRPIARLLGRGFNLDGLPTPSLDVDVGHLVTREGLGGYGHPTKLGYLYSRKNFKLNRSAALAEWRELCAA